ncbi:MAG: hypothetical protein OK454_08350, partial [Thaumarchaeota archaeon]|nr:hypothetical protein [Nitrososphaerota archaeon]
MESLSVSQNPPHTAPAIRNTHPRAEPGRDGDGDGDGDDLQLVVLLLQLAAELLQLLLEPDRLAQLGAALVLFLLQLVAALLVLDALALVALQLGQELGAALGQVVDLLHVVHLGRLAVELAVR